ncbi:hypothetical protein HS9_00135 [Bacillus velezensis]|nr:hypothetical protein HS9_00135 [Bacillus velezensis]
MVKFIDSFTKWVTKMTTYETKLGSKVDRDLVLYEICILKRV